MPYTDRFIATDNLITHLSTVIETISDASIQASYAGFLSVSAVTVYELAIKDIFNEFALKKNKVFGAFVENHFDRINGRIKLKDLKEQHIPLFGSKYLDKFKKELEQKENSIFSTSRVSVKSNYGNLIICRHEFVHEGSPTLTVTDVMNSYQYGKEVIHSLYNAMKR